MHNAKSYLIKSYWWIQVILVFILLVIVNFMLKKMDISSFSNCHCWSLLIFTNICKAQMSVYIFKNCHPIGYISKNWAGKFSSTCARGLVKFERENSARFQVIFAQEKFQVYDPKLNSARHCWSLLIFTNICEAQLNVEI